MCDVELEASNAHILRMNFPVKQENIMCPAVNVKIFAYSYLLEFLMKEKE